ncbi:hypothetical protein AB0D42_20555 [Streptomyces sp. NPDC048304]|jgi:hypothetical protein|uniref:hypothetical protein n=1 Tax=unclassified Streptomyces TaxID=2593676 RepID=UPI0033D076E1
MPATAELIGATVALLGLGILTLCSVRSITRRSPSPMIPEPIADAAHAHDRGR